MRGKRVYFVGAGIVLLAVLLVLGVIFIPRLMAKSDMETLLQKAAAADVQYVMLVDPTFKHAGALAGEGREVKLEGECLQDVRKALQDLADGFSYEDKEGELSGALGLHLLVRTAEGEVVKIFFAKDRFYTTLKGARYYFSADDAQAYASFYETLEAALPVFE